MRVAVATVAAVWLLMVSAAAAVRAADTVISDSSLGITLTIPDGFEPVPDFQSPPGFDIRHAYQRTPTDGQPGVVIMVERLPGPRVYGETYDQAIQRRGGAQDVGDEQWKSHSLDVLVEKETLAGNVRITRRVQVPIMPNAIQLRVVGAESQDAELAELTRTLLASLDGPTNWLSEEERRRQDTASGLAMTCLWLAAVAGVVYLLTAWRTWCFRTKALALGIPKERARQRIRPSWAWYLLPVYLFWATLCIVAAVIFLDMPDIVLMGLGISGVCFVVAAVLAVLIMRRRMRFKLRLLTDDLPPLPPPEPPL
jgi:hypothetical protein